MVIDVVYVQGIYCRNLPIGIDPNAVWSKSDDDDVLWLLIFCSKAP